MEYAISEKYENNHTASGVRGVANPKYYPPDTSL